MYCSKCKHQIYKYEKDEIGFPDFSKPIIDCKKGNTKEVKSWWVRNGHKKQDETKDEMSCYEKSEGDKILDLLLEKTDQLIKIIDSNKEL